MNSQKDLFDELSEQNNYDDFSPSMISEPDEYFGGDIFDKIASEEDSVKKYGFFDTVKDIGQQILAKGAQGLLGSYGDLGQTLGLTREEKTPGEKQRANIEEDVIGKIQEGTASPQEIYALSSLEEGGYPTRLPTQKDVASGIESLTGIAEGKTPAGRIAGRGSQLLGETASFGGVNPVVAGAAAASGLAGQSIRELGGPEEAAMATEIVGQLSPSAISKKLIGGKVANPIIKAGRAIGLSENQITPLIQSERKVATLGKVARKGGKTEKLFSSIKKTLGDSYDSLKSSPEAKINLGASNKTKLYNSFDSIKKNLEKTLKPSDEKKKAIDFIDSSMKNLKKKNPTPEDLMNFWQDINKTVDWGKIDGGKKVLSSLKEPILESIKSSSGKLAEGFELTNMLYSKYAQIAKKLKPDMVDSFLKAAEVIGIPASAVSIATGNLTPLYTVATEASMRTLAREMLINPYFQNIASKMVKNFNSGSFNAIKDLSKQIKEYMTRKHPNEDWSFLQEDLDLVD